MKRKLRKNALCFDQSAFSNFALYVIRMIFFFINKFIVNNTGQYYKQVTQGQRKGKEADIQMQLSLTENE